MSVSARRAAGNARDAGNDLLRRQLVQANHILAQHGIVDGWGHVSVRSDERDDRFLVARSVAPATVRPADVLELDVATGETVGEGRSYLERHIHAGIYRARPDVRAVVHNHAPALIPFGVTGTPLRPVSHVAAFLGEHVPTFEIRDTAGPASSMLVDSPELGDALAASLADATVVLMRGHGASVAATSLPHVVYRSVYAVQNAHLQAEAMRLGSVTYLSSEEAKLAAETVDSGVDRVWNLWAGSVSKANPGWGAG
ncbi:MULTISPECIES: class II aldolase/adducin family protein [unclassified Amycolatopsis]|uniref:class II aldolase/adducin family protein n=1 Tax=unclassified Amycolatopsis TaxID=2618356 RepID=UPI001C69729D|nr:class II aldolase/adducin family protein [Amycolatopsis sp. DSM 110486]QYN20204.1 class II aldolase/adducin family protein [Amycolatopsis sp. DSM 110486]